MNPSHSMFDSDRERQSSNASVRGEDPATELVSKLLAETSDWTLGTG